MTRQKVRSKFVSEVLFANNNYHCIPKSMQDVQDTDRLASRKQRGKIDDNGDNR